MPPLLPLTAVGGKRASKFKVRFKGVANTKGVGGKGVGYTFPPNSTRFHFNTPWNSAVGKGVGAKGAGAKGAGAKGAGAKNPGKSKGKGTGKSHRPIGYEPGRRSSMRSPSAKEEGMEAPPRALQPNVRCSRIS